MLRRLLGIICIVGFTVLIGATIASQFKCIYLYAKHFSFIAGKGGCAVVYSPDDFGWETNFADTDPNIYDLFVLPQIERRVPGLMTAPATFMEIPFWCLLSTWALLSLIVWRSTGRGKVDSAFPVEPSALEMESRFPPSERAR